MDTVGLSSTRTAVEDSILQHSRRVDGRVNAGGMSHRHQLLRPKTPRLRGLPTKPVLFKVPAATLRSIRSCVLENQPHGCLNINH